ncbi:MAG: Dethiobiotin synthetase [uncultured bacterium]|nr:MAG: Dethiobiotin synthetase [uncultured bacterium]
MTDVDSVRSFTGLPDSHFLDSAYSFKEALSPYHAARQEGKDINLARCYLPATSGFFIVEGAGGVYVPINQQHCMLDLMQQLALPIIVVCHGTLGTINHTLLTIEALRARYLPIHGVVFSGELFTENREAIEAWGKVKTLFHLPLLTLKRATLQTWALTQKKQILAALDIP